MPPKPSRTHAWRNWRKLPKEQQEAREPSADGEMPQVDVTTLTPQLSRAADVASLERVQAGRALKPPGRA